MPADDLLRFIEGPQSFSQWWLVLGVVLILVTIAWCVGVFLWTLPPGRLQRTPVLGQVNAGLSKRRFAKSARRIGDRFRSGAITSAQASAELSALLRSFLSVATGTRAQYLHVSEIAESPVESLAGAAPLLTDLDRARYDPSAPVDVAALQRAAEELISAWN